MSAMKCPVPHCRHTMKVHSLTPDGLYFCKCSDGEVVKVTKRPGFYGGWEKALVQSSEEERQEFLQRAPQETHVVGPHKPQKGTE